MFVWQGGAESFRGISKKILRFFSSQRQALLASSKSSSFYMRNLKKLCRLCMRCDNLANKYGHISHTLLEKSTLSLACFSLERPEFNVKSNQKKLR